MSIEKTCGLLREPYPEDFTQPLPREFFGPAAIPIAEGVMALFTAVSTSVSQNKAAHAAEALQGQEEQTIGQQQQIAGQIANQPIDLSGITRAGQSGIETLKTTGGGVANLGAAVQQLLGTNQLSAQQGAVGQKTTNLNAAAGILGGTNASLNQLGTQAGAAASAGGNPWVGAAGSILNAVKPSGSARSAQPVVTGPGAPGGGDINNPASAGGAFNTPAPVGSGFGFDTSSWGTPVAA